jgi:hypothetical protein
MKKYAIEKTFSWKGQISEKVSAIMRAFGVSLERLTEEMSTHQCRVSVNDGDIVFITGPSGSGKSVLLKQLKQAVPADESIDLDEIELAGDKSLIDCIEGDVWQVLKLLSIAGLNDVFCILNQPANLSEGQKYRFRLAVALASNKRFIFADEFCTNLDRITAAVISYNIRKFAERNNVTFFLASSHDDLLSDLAPDVLVVKDLSGPAEVVYRRGKSQCVSAVF